MTDACLDYSSNTSILLFTQVQFCVSTGGVLTANTIQNMKHLLDNLMRRALCKQKETQCLEDKFELSSTGKYCPFPDVQIPEPKMRSVWTYIVFLVLSIVASFSYLSWRVWNVKETLSNIDSLEWWEIVGAFLRFSGEIMLTVLAYIQTVYIVLLLWRGKLKSVESFDLNGIQVEKFDKDIEMNEKVDIIIPCCKEPLEMIKDTVSAVIAIDWTVLDIYVCDDGADDDLKEWVDYLDKEAFKNLPKSMKRTIKCVRRVKNNPHHAKAGNINNCFKNFCYSKYVAVIDADMIIHPSFLRRTIPMFGENVAYVQIPQT